MAGQAGVGRLRRAAERHVKNDNEVPFLTGDHCDPLGLAQALTESRELLALAEESAGIGIWDTDLATDMVKGRPTFFRLMGLPVSTVAIPNDVVRAVRHPEDAPRVRAGFLEALARGADSYEVEYRIIRPNDGELRWIFGRGRTLRDAAGKPVRYSGVDIDITERKRAEEHVRLLMHEVNHRANNLLTVIQALARFTANTPGARDFAERLVKRIMALAGSSNLLVSGKWQGVEIATFVRFATRPLRGRPRRASRARGRRPAAQRPGGAGARHGVLRARHQRREARGVRQPDGPCRDPLAAQPRAQRR